MLSFNLNYILLYWRYKEYTVRVCMYVTSCWGCSPPSLFLIITSDERYFLSKPFPINFCEERTPVGILIMSFKFQFSWKPLGNSLIEFASTRFKTSDEMKSLNCKEPFFECRLKFECDYPEVKFSKLDHQFGTMEWQSWYPGVTVSKRHTHTQECKYVRKDSAL